MAITVYRASWWGFGELIPDCLCKMVHTDLGQTHPSFTGARCGACVHGVCECVLFSGIYAYLSLLNLSEWRIAGRL